MHKNRSSQDSNGDSWEGQFFLVMSKWLWKLLLRSRFPTDRSTHSLESSDFKGTVLDSHVSHSDKLQSGGGLQKRFQFPLHTR